MGPVDKNLSLQIQVLQQEIVRSDLEIKNGISVIRDSRGISQFRLNELTRAVKEKQGRMQQLVGSLETTGLQVCFISNKGCHQECIIE